MPVRLRLKRMGSKRNPHYRVVVADARVPRDGKAIEEVGYYNPKADPPQVQLKEDRVVHWLLTGAQPTETVRSLLHRAGILARVAEIRRQQREARSQN
ncbi:MAG: 30S ribosomal protein S16 [Armatimonadetes bacterium]|nr:30S ribosomal protein S16 [Armatimonadota bacterium]